MDIYGKIVNGNLVDERAAGFRYNRPPIESSDGRKLSTPNTAEQLIDAGYKLRVAPVIGENQTKGALIENADNYTYQVIDMSAEDVAQKALAVSDSILPRAVYEIMDNLVGPIDAQKFPTSYEEYANKKAILAAMPASFMSNITSKAISGTKTIAKTTATGLVGAVGGATAALAPTYAPELTNKIITIATELINKIYQ